MSQQAVVSLTAEEEKTLRQWARAGTSEHRLVERAKVILLLNQGKANFEIARQLKTRPARLKMAATVCPAPPGRLEGRGPKRAAIDLR